MEASIDNAIVEMALKVGGQTVEPKQEPVLEIHNSGPMIGKVSANLASSSAGSAKKKSGGTTLARAERLTQSQTKFINTKMMIGLVNAPYHRK